MSLSQVKQKITCLFLSLLILPQVASAIVTNSSESNNHIGFKMIQETLKDNKTSDKNVLISPISAQLAFGMLYNGATNQSAKTLSSFMGFNEVFSASVLNNQNQQRISQLIKAPEAPQDPSPFYQKPVTLNIANAAFTTNGATDGVAYNFTQSFVDSLQTFYFADSASMDFKKPQAAKTINQWAEDNTEGMIPKIIEPDDLKDLLWVLMNATYLEGKWSHSFYKRPAKHFNEPNFTTVDNQKQTLDFMSSKISSFKYYKNDRLEAIELPLVGENGLSSVKAYVVLPSNIEQFKAMKSDKASIWNANFWNALFGSMNSNKSSLGSLSMPTFNFDFTVTMKKSSALTEALGLSQIFSNGASFDKMDQPNGPKSKVGIIKQSSKIEWDEKGLKAAAVTLIGGIAKTSITPIQPEFRMVVDKPFYFAIYDEVTKSFLFLGAVTQP